MGKTDLSQLIVPNTKLEDWMGLFGKGGRRDYGLEFLTEATEGTLRGMPGIERYVLQPAAPRANIEDTMREIVSEEIVSEARRRYLLSKRVRESRQRWRNDQIPHSVRAINQLREDPNSDFHIDLLKPKSYAGSYLDVDGIPLCHPFLRQLAYLSGSVICGGWIDTPRMGSGEIYPPGRGLSVENKLRGCIIGKPPQEERYKLKRVYSHLLVLAGTGKGSLIEADFEQLGTSYIETLAGLSSEDRLSGHDKKHALSVLRRFTEALTDHNLEVDRASKTITYMPQFAKEETRDRFWGLARKAFELTEGVKYAFIHSETRMYRM